MICLTLSEGQFVYFKDDELVDYLMCFSDICAEEIQLSMYFRLA